MAHPKNRRRLERRKPKREPYDRVLIVCEGAKTEPNYLRELVRAYRLSSANVEITGDSDSAPMSVVDYAITHFEADPDFNAVFCVFDRDQHRRFKDAVARIHEKQLVRRDEKHHKVGVARFDAIVSIPCFEYWILLHHQYTTAALPRFADVEPLLKAIPAHAHYAKGEHDLFAKTQPCLDVALSNADRANAAAAAAGTDNPTTQMPVLIRYLLELAEKKHP